MATEPVVDGGVRARPGEGRGFRVLLGLAVIGVLALLWPALCTAPALHWNPARLAPSFALAYGKSFYALRNSAEQLGWIYGPVFPLWYLPVTLTSNPTVALVLATLVNALTLLVPVVLTVHYAGSKNPRTLLALSTIFAALLFAHPVLRWQFYFVHVDAVCLALGLIACLALQRAVERNEGWPLHVAALAVALALWTKQLAVMLAPGMLLWLWCDGHRRWISPFLVRCVVYAAAIGVATFQWFGTEPVIFNVVYFHLLRSPEDGAILAGRWLGDVVVGLWTWLPLGGVVAWFLWRTKARRYSTGAAGRDEPGAGRPSVPASRPRALVRLLLWVALTQAPLGILALFKSGGGVNSLHSLHYLMVAGMVLLAARLEGRDATGRGGPGWGLGAALLATVAIGFWQTRREDAEWRLYRGQEQLLAQVRASPNTYYLPWNPLITLIGEHKIYPFDDALKHLSLRHLEVPPAIVRAALPPKPILLYYEPVQSQFALRYFPEMKR